MNAAHGQSPRPRHGADRLGAASGTGAQSKRRANPSWSAPESTDDRRPRKIATARAIARRTDRTVQENLFVGVGAVHVLCIIAALLGWIGPIQAAIIHLPPDGLVFVNFVKLLQGSYQGRAGGPFTCQFGA